MSLTYQIRGGLGTQLLNLISAYGDAYAHKKDIEKVVLNFGNYPEGLREININFISKVISTPIIFESKDGTQKFPIFKEKRIKKVKKFIDRIREAMPIKHHNIDPAGRAIMHVRQLDRPLVSAKVYEKELSHIPKSMVIGDDPKVLNDLVEGQLNDTIHSPHNNDSVKEWLMVHSSNNVVGGFSSYILSAALLNPNLNYMMFNKNYCNEGLLTQNDWNCLDLFTQLFDNISWVDD
tara:strand:+ start:2931 stop:3635 length:705 start_codon:yes stop_codon:yes gene_type:complete